MASYASPLNGLLKMEKESVGEGHSKCLILGGYLVLDNKNTGVVLSLEPKIKCISKKIVDAENSYFTVHVNVLPYNYTLKLRESDWTEPSSFVNKFERYILGSLHVFFKKYPIPDFSISMQIIGDPEFYNENGKVGLGSSSATTVSIIKSLFGLFDPNLENPEEKIFKFSSVAHSITQGNVGSCFDISCAIWGSQIFRRPSPEFINFDRIDDKWDYEVIPQRSSKSSIHVLLLSTPFAGSGTPGLVRQFLLKSKGDPELYEKLRFNVSLASEALFSYDITRIRSTFKTVRNTLIEITNKWGVPVVPIQVEKIAEEAESIDSVIVSVIPGAGGFDSIAVLAEHPNIDFSSIGLKVIAHAQL